MSDAGRTCPLRYRYGAAALAQTRTEAADILYVIGGLYGNPYALEALDALIARDTGPVRLCFNGDFNWFNVSDDDFVHINEAVLAHDAILGNVEIELDSADATAGCGCAYPPEVEDSVVERSNRIHTRLRDTAQRHPALLARLAALPMVRRYRVGSLSVGVVHGDADSLAGWSFAVDRLREPSNAPSIEAAFDTAQVALLASSHTCLPVCERFGPDRAVINNGAAGMPNFAGRAHGVITRIATTPASTADALYGVTLRGTHVDALALHYDTERWSCHFLRTWPPGSDAHVSYFDRIRHGPDHRLEDARSQRS